MSPWSQRKIVFVLHGPRMLNSSCPRNWLNTKASALAGAKDKQAARIYYFQVKLQTSPRPLKEPSPKRIQDPQWAPRPHQGPPRSTGAQPRHDIPPISDNQSTKQLTSDLPQARWQVCCAAMQFNDPVLNKTPHNKQRTPAHQPRSPYSLAGAHTSALKRARNIAPDDCQIV